MDRLISGIATKRGKKDFKFDQSISQFTYKLGVPKQVVKKVLSNIDSYYGKKEDVKTYADGTPKTKNGVVQKRVMHPSYAELKWIQKRIKKRILAKIQYPINIQGGLEKRDNIKNARLHLGKKYHLCTDLSRFFPSITNKMVYNRFIDLGYSSDVARIITRLITYKGKIPQGAPTSTHIANLIYYPFDEYFINYCEERNIFYSRFIDDISLSSQHNFKEFTKELLDVIHFSDFKINHRKTFYCQGKALITGILVSNNVLNVKKALEEKLIDPELEENSRKALQIYRDRVKFK